MNIFVRLSQEQRKKYIWLVSLITRQEDAEEQYNFICFSTAKISKKALFLHYPR